jgi:hypothetical protein
MKEFGAVAGSAAMILAAVSVASEKPLLGPDLVMIPEIRLEAESVVPEPDVTETAA